MGKLVLKKEHLEKLSKIVEDNLNGFQRGEFEQVIVNHLKNYLKIY